MVFEIDSKDEFMTVREAAFILKVSTQTIRDYIHRRENPLPAVKLSYGNYRIYKKLFKDWIEALADPRQNV